MSKTEWMVYHGKKLMKSENFIVQRKGNVSLGSSMSWNLSVHFSRKPRWLVTGRSVFLKP